jgi:spore germination protein YaaH
MEDRMKRLITLAALLAFSSTPAFSMQKYFYFLRSKHPEMQAMVNKGVNSLKSHYQSIDGLITQSYYVDKNGEVAGYLNQEMMSFAAKHHIKVIAMITNAGFNKTKTHEFLTNSKAQQSALSQILSYCRENQFYGVQFDFENINVKDKSLLTNFLVTAANLLHQQKYNVSFAVVPALKNGEQVSAYQQRKYDNWSGAYDLAALGKAGDFISIMSYDQHQSGTTPGPYAGFRWLEAVIKHAAQFVPANKISLGLPSYSSHWYTGARNDHIGVRTEDISFQAAQTRLKENKASIRWDDVDKVHYAIYQRGWLNQYIFMEDEKSYKEKIKLVKKYKLHGISVFYLGGEDPLIWKKP